MRTEEPRAINLKDYRAPDYRISEIALAFVLDPQSTRVTATMKVARQGGAVPLVLNGEHLTLILVAIDGKALPPDAYGVTDELLTIPSVPANFSLEIVTEISPANNTALSGLYTSKGIFCTQCEPEGFRRITYFLDRPDNLAVYKVKMVADKTLAPVLLANGNLVESGDAGDGTHFAVWEDPFPK